MSKQNYNKYKIFLYTKFSIPCFPIKKSYPTKALNFDLSLYNEYISYLYDPKRMLSRLFFFENITVPSIFNQTYKNFEWIVFIHKNLPQEYYNKICTINQKYNNIFNLVIIINDSSQNKNLFQYHKPDEENYISVRLDDDDGLHHTYFSLVNETFNNNYDINICGSKSSLLLSKNNQDIYYNFNYKKYLISCGLAAKNCNIFNCGNHATIHERYKCLELKQKNLCLMSCGDHTITNRPTILNKKFDMKLYLDGYDYE